MPSKETTLVSIGDFVDVYHKIKQRGVGKIISAFNLNSGKRVSGKWDAYKTTSDFWIIPELTEYWNKKISGDPNMEYEEYVAKKYLTGEKKLRMLSVGCGEGSHERNFAKYGNFSEIIGVDLSEKRIQTAATKAQKENLPITYFSKDFRELNFDKAYFDVILFNASLHHFKNLHSFLEIDIKPFLAEDGLLIINEYCGPNRLQWTKQQLDASNSLLKKLPHTYRLLTDGKTVKKKIYRPGILRMLLVDPSEAPDSANLVSAVHANFKVLEETKLGWNILHLLLKGIAHNFLKRDDETKEILAHLIDVEEKFVREVNTSDSVFGVYKK